MDTEETVRTVILCIAFTFMLTATTLGMYVHSMYPEIGTCIQPQEVQNEEGN